MTGTATLPSPGNNCRIVELYLDGEAVVGYRLFAPGLYGGCDLGTRGRVTSEAVHEPLVNYLGRYRPEEIAVYARAARLAEACLVEAPCFSAGHAGLVPLAGWLKDEWRALGRVE